MPHTAAPDARRFEGSAGRQFSQTGASGTYGSTYDPAGRRVRLTHPDGFFVQQDYLVTGEMTCSARWAKGALVFVSQSKATNQDK